MPGSTYPPSRPRGFDRGSAGVQLLSVQVEIDRSQIRFLAKVLGLKDEIHFDVNAAREAGFRDLVAPPSILMVVEAAADEVRVKRDQPTLLHTLGADLRYLLHGDERYIYIAPLCAGDRVSFAATVGAFADKKGGLIEVVTIGSEISHATEGLLIRAERTLLHRFG